MSELYSIYETNLKEIFQQLNDLLQAPIKNNGIYNIIINIINKHHK